MIIVVLLFIFVRMTCLLRTINVYVVQIFQHNCYNMRTILYTCDIYVDVLMGTFTKSFSGMGGYIASTDEVYMCIIVVYV